jgi:monofunctional biosynthetic peptidoglycan transglycosylase
MMMTDSRKSFSIVRSLAVIAVGAALLSAQLVLLLRWVPPPTSAFMLQERLSAREEGRRNYRLHYQWVDWKQISPQAALAVVAAEDQKFPEHLGFDIESIEKAIEEKDRRGRLRGASTISQQVAKNLFLWPEHSFVRKGLEAYFTVLIELLWPKHRILEVYLNICQFGDGIYGIAAASQQFFKKKPNHLSQREAALLAAVLPNPELFRVDRPSAYVLQRRAWILEQMSLLGGPDYLKGL